MWLILTASFTYSLAIAKQLYAPSIRTSTRTRIAFTVINSSSQTISVDTCVGATDGLAEALALADGETEALGDEEALALGDTEVLGETDALAELEADALGDTEADGDTEALALELAEADGETEADALELAEADGERLALGDTDADTADGLADELGESEADAVGDADADGDEDSDADGDTEEEGDTEGESDSLTELLNTIPVTRVKNAELALATFLISIFKRTQFTPSIVPSTLKVPLPDVILSAKNCRPTCLYSSTFIGSDTVFTVTASNNIDSMNFINFIKLRLTLFGDLYYWPLSQ